MCFFLFRPHLLFSSLFSLSTLSSLPGKSPFVIEARALHKCPLFFPCVSLSARPLCCVVLNNNNNNNNNNLFTLFFTNVPSSHLEPPHSGPFPHHVERHSQPLNLLSLHSTLLLSNPFLLFTQQLWTPSKA